MFRRDGVCGRAIKGGSSAASGARFVGRLLVRIAVARPPVTPCDRRAEIDNRAVLAWRLTGCGFPFGGSRLGWLPVGLAGTAVFLDRRREIQGGW